MKLDKKQEVIDKKETEAALFAKVGIVVLSILMIIGFGIKVLPGAVTVYNTNSKLDLPINCVNTEEKRVALSFDTDLGDDDIQNILSILAKHDVQATFFITGEWVNKYPDDVKAIAAAGHDLGNHSENHKQMSQLTEDQCVEEIMSVHKRIKELTGMEMVLFRAPFGDYNNSLIALARECGYYTIQWDVDSEDWKDYGVDSIVKSVGENKHLGNGSIILMHNGAKYTPEALENVITGLQNKGYEIVPISQMIYTGDYTVDQTGRQMRK